jgi:RNA polymerase primary sigma factor
LILADDGAAMFLPAMSDILGDYLRSISRYPLLTQEEELHLGRLVRLWQDEEQPCPAVKRRGERALRRMVVANLRLVVSVVTKYRRGARTYSVEPVDLIQAGNLGLIRAVEKYDPSRGYRFSTYAYWWIRQAVTRYLHDQASSVRLPASLTALVGRIEAAIGRHGGGLSVQQLAVLLEESPARIQKALLAQTLRLPISLDQEIVARDNSDCSLLNTITDDRGPVIEDDYQWFRPHLEKLSGHELEFLRLRFVNEDRFSMAQMAEHLGKSRCQVQTIERRLLSKLRTSLAPVVNP